MKFSKTIRVSVMLTMMIYCILGLPFMDPQSRTNYTGVIVLGIVIWCLTLLYNTSLSLLTVSLMHFFGSLITFLAVAYFGKWYPFTLGVVSMSIAGFIAIFMVTWAVFYLSDKKKLDKMNEELK